MNSTSTNPTIAGWSAAGASSAAEELPVSDLPDLAPVSEDDYARVLDYITTHRPEWESQLHTGRTNLARHLTTAGYLPVFSAERPDLAAGVGVIEPGTVLLSARLKDAGAIVAKMRRFGEPLRVMLDTWGYRLVVSDLDALDTVANHCTSLWATPAPDELLLRHGELQFQPWRDYRRRDHAGLSAATTDRYDQAIHLNRKAPFGIVEIQIMTYDLYRRVHCDPASPDSHDTFVARRQALLAAEPTAGPE
jgi:hypothetical protein